MTSSVSEPTMQTSSSMFTSLYKFLQSTFIKESDVVLFITTNTDVFHLLAGKSKDLSECYADSSSSLVILLSSEVSLGLFSDLRLLCLLICMPHLLSKLGVYPFEHDLDLQFNSQGLNILFENFGERKTFGVVEGQYEVRVRRDKNLEALEMFACVF